LTRRTGFPARPMPAFLLPRLPRFGIPPPP
jgi:hypothetical protein